MEDSMISSTLEATREGELIIRDEWGNRQPLGSGD